MDAQNGIPSRRPMIELTIPSSLDPTLAPKGHHVASLFVQYTPYTLKVKTNKHKSDLCDYYFIQLVIIISPK